MPCFDMVKQDLLDFQLSIVSEDLPNGLVVVVEDEDRDLKNLVVDGEESFVTYLDRAVCIHYS